MYVYILGILMQISHLTVACTHTHTHTVLDKGVVLKPLNPVSLLSFNASHISLDELQKWVRWEWNRGLDYLW